MGVPQEFCGGRYFGCGGLMRCDDLLSGAWGCDLLRRGPLCARGGTTAFPGAECAKFGLYGTPQRGTGR